MATGIYPPGVPLQYFDNAGHPLAAGTLETFIAGTTTHLATYSDVNLTIANANPMTLDASGRPAAGSIFLNPGSSYKFVLRDARGATMATPDNILAVSSSTNLEVSGVLAETVVPGAILALADGSFGTAPAGRWVNAFTTISLTDAALINFKASITPELGFATVGGGAGDTINIRMEGRVTGYTGLVTGALYYVGPTPGVIALSTDFSGRSVGQADSPTSLVINTGPPQKEPFATIPNASGTLAFDASLSSVLYIVGVGNCTLGKPTNPTHGQQLRIRFWNASASPTTTLTLAPLFNAGTNPGGYRFGSVLTGPLTATAVGLVDYITLEFFDNCWDVIAVRKG